MKGGKGVKVRPTGYCSCSVLAFLSIHDVSSVFLCAPVHFLLDDTRRLWNTSRKKASYERTIK